MILYHTLTIQLIHLMHQKGSAHCLNFCAVVMVTEKIARVKSDRTAAIPVAASRALNRFLFQLLIIRHKSNAAQYMNGWVQTNNLNIHFDKCVMFSLRKGLKQLLTYQVFSSI